MARLGSRFHEVHSVPVIYRRKNVGEIEILVTPLYTSQQEVIPGVAITQVHNMDWGISVEDLTFDGTPTKPLHDDQIETAEGLIFRVVSRGNDAPFHYTTSLRDRVRVYSDRMA
jgi:hypothetical protein